MLVLVIALWASASALAGPRQVQRGLENAVELADGTGLVVVNLRGALIGSARNATLTITDLPGRTETEILVQGAASRHDVDDQTSVYQCNDCRFRVFRGKWKIRIQGEGIFASFVGEGTFGLVGTSGRFSYAGAPDNPWPTEWQVTKLGD